MLLLIVCLVHSSATLLDTVMTVSTSVLMESVWTTRSLREDDLHINKQVTIRPTVNVYTDLRASVILSTKDNILFTVEASSD